MGILQLEISDETMRELEARAAACNLDLQSWMREQIETVLLGGKKFAWEEEKLLEALDSPVIEIESEWWGNTSAGLNIEADGRRGTEMGR